MRGLRSILSLSTTEESTIETIAYNNGSRHGGLLSQRLIEEYFVRAFAEHEGVLGIK